MNILEDLLGDWIINVINWYIQTFMLIVSPEMLFIQLELLVIIYIVLQVLELLFPLVRRLITALFLPFRILHVWLHLQVAHQLDLQVSDPNNQLVVNQFFTSLVGDDRLYLGIKAPKNTKDAYRIAMAPTKGAIILVLLSFVSSPILICFGLLGFFLHLYILFGSLTTLWADIKDYLFAYQVALMNADLNPRYLAWVAPVFGISILIAFISISDLMRALLTGISFSIFYLLGLLWVASHIAKLNPSEISEGELPILKKSQLFPFPEIILVSCKEKERN